MALGLTSVLNGNTAVMTLSGSLDAGTAPALTAEVQKAIAQNCSRVVFMANALEYVASAGLRVILFARQKLGKQGEIYMIAPQDEVLRTLERSGFDQAVIIRDSYEAAN